MGGRGRRAERAYYAVDVKAAGFLEHALIGARDLRETSEPAHTQGGMEWTDHRGEPCAELTLRPSVDICICLLTDRRWAVAARYQRAVLIYSRLDSDRACRAMYAVGHWCRGR